MENKIYCISEEDKLACIEDGVDAVFLPGKIHGCEDQIYIIYFNAQADNERGCFEIEKIDWERILELYDEVGGNTEAFWDILPDWFHGEWEYCNTDHDDFDELVEAYPTADFICGRDGGGEEELEFILKWARSRKESYTANKD